ncbi:MAG: glycosyltransferase family 39 protein [Acidobacteria bacterium]|nr:glycosyltransferase family 39 protein [Acidobacteriota bacterium]
MTPELAANHGKDAGQRSRRRGLVLLLVILTAGAVAAGLGSIQIRNTALSFDGGMNAQVALSLVEDGRYATRYRGLHDFDHRVQTGPTLLFPVAMVYAVLGPGETVLQLPSLAYLVLLVVLGAYYAGRHAGPAAAALAAVLILQTPRLFDFGLRLYGEVPALVFFILGLLLLDRMGSRAGRGIALVIGAAFGLAVLTKIMMLISVAALGAAFVVDRWLLRRASVRYWGSMLGGFVLVHVPFEAYKLLVLGPRVYGEWWSTMARRAFAQGSSYGMPFTLHGAHKLEGHLEILVDKSQLPELTLVVFLVAATLLLAALLTGRWRESHSERALPFSLVVVALAAVLNLLWWLTLSATSHTWLRRAFPGLILQEIVAAVALTWGMAVLVRRGGTPDRSRARRHQWWWTVVLLTAALVLGTGSFLWHGLSQMDLHRQPTAERVDTDAMADTIRHLNRTVVLYARGWYQAPVLAALTGRMLRDFNQFPLSSYRKPLINTFFVVDAALYGNQPEEVENVLERSDHTLVSRAGKFFLYRLDEVFPYRPIPAPSNPSELLTVYRPKDDEYPFASGLGDNPEWPAVSRAVSGVLLKPGHRRCLHVRVWVPPDMGQRPHFEVRVDGTPVVSVRPAGGHSWDQVIELPPGIPGRTDSALVELWMRRDGHQWRFTLRPSTGKFVLEEVGFVACDPLQAPDSHSAVDRPSANASETR